MKSILSSATKITLLVLIFVLCLVTVYAVIIGTNRALLDPKDVLTLFGLVITSVVSFYFGKSEGQKEAERKSKEDGPIVG